ncbi:uncharacterized protein Smp_201790 [Schistosoma mansoni]|uniref:uncharacterized protein n=1 Tax=Schistosoma mansoni TaxID=6183 RepID=UPI00022DC204|nr:uncharacterized protein Smp_201790 [Schistosoma mansoni]|eukprot:XP_018650141.1 uncharacterized protein Smp_201790 [Schistosoma mansoni]
MSRNFYSLGYHKDIIYFVTNFLHYAQFTYKKILPDLRPVGSCFVLLWDSSEMPTHQESNLALTDLTESA